MLDTLEFSISWQDRKCIDLDVMFGLVHRSAMSQGLCDAIVYILECHVCKTFAYIDDLVTIAPSTQATSQFQFLSDLLDKLCLSVSQGKKIPPTKFLLV